MSWSVSAISAINDIKKNILKKKVLLNIIIESYSWYDKAVKYVHMFLAVATPVVIYVDQITASDQSSTAAIVVSAVVAGMIKLKEYLKFTKTKDQAKQQTVKYQQLFQRIEREMRKNDGKQNEEDFISWVNRELSIIEIDDPDVPQSLKKIFIATCQEKGIPYDEDLEALSELFGSATVKDVSMPAVKGKKIEDDKVKTPEVKSPDIKIDIPESHQTESSHQINSQHLGKSISVEVDAQPNINTISINTRYPSSPLANKETYRREVAEFDPTRDTSWALERLAEINNSGLL